MGHRDSSLSAEALIEDAQKSPELNIIKTHEHPLTNEPCIFVVRDGRSSIVSYFHFLKEIAGLNLTLEQVINGEVFAESWSDFYHAWQPRIRPNTLLLRYEKIASDPAQAIRSLGSFLRLEPSGDFNLSFSSLRSLNAKERARNNFPLCGAPRADAVVPRRQG